MAHYFDLDAFKQDYTYVNKALNLWKAHFKEAKFPTTTWTIVQQLARRILLETTPELHRKIVQDQGVIKKMTDSRLIYGSSIVYFRFAFQKYLVVCQELKSTFKTTTQHISKENSLAVTNKNQSEYSLGALTSGRQSRLIRQAPSVCQPVYEFSRKQPSQRISDSEDEESPDDIIKVEFSLQDEPAKDWNVLLNLTKCDYLSHFENDAALSLVAIGQRN